MAVFRELADKYQKKSKAALTDSITAGLSLADNVAVDVGLLGDSGLLSDALETLSVALPLAVIALTEGGRALLGRKSTAAAVQDAGFRALKTGAAMGAGAVAAGLGAGALPAIPVALGVRMLLDKYRSRALMGHRLQMRIKRLRALREHRQGRGALSPWQALPEGSHQGR